MRLSLNIWYADIHYKNGDIPAMLRGKYVDIELKHLCTRNLHTSGEEGIFVALVDKSPKNAGDRIFTFDNTYEYIPDGTAKTLNNDNKNNTNSPINTTENKIFFHRDSRCGGSDQHNILRYKIEDNTRLNEHNYDIEVWIGTLAYLKKAIANDVSNDTNPEDSPFFGGIIKDNNLTSIYDDFKEAHSRARSSDFNSSLPTFSLGVGLKDDNEKTVNGSDEFYNGKLLSKRFNRWPVGFYPSTTRNHQNTYNLVNRDPSIASGDTNNSTTAWTGLVDLRVRGNTENCVTVGTVELGLYDFDFNTPKYQNNNLKIHVYEVQPGKSWSGGKGGLSESINKYSDIYGGDEDAANKLTNNEKGAVHRFFIPALKTVTKAKHEITDVNDIYKDFTHGQRLIVPTDAVGNHKHDQFFEGIEYKVLVPDGTNGISTKDRKRANSYSDKKVNNVLDGANASIKIKIPNIKSDHHYQVYVHGISWNNHIQLQVPKTFKDSSPIYITCKKLDLRRDTDNNCELVITELWTGVLKDSDGTHVARGVNGSYQHVSGDTSHYSAPLDLGLFDNKGSILPTTVAGEESKWRSANRFIFKNPPDTWWYNRKYPGKETKEVTKDSLKNWREYEHIIVSSNTNASKKKNKEKSKDSSGVSQWYGELDIGDFHDYSEEGDYKLYITHYKNKAGDREPINGGNKLLLGGFIIEGTGANKKIYLAKPNSKHTAEQDIVKDDQSWRNSETDVTYDDCFNPKESPRFLIENCSVSITNFKHETRDEITLKLFLKSGLSPTPTNQEWSIKGFKDDDYYKKLFQDYQTQPSSNYDYYANFKKIFEDGNIADNTTYTTTLQYKGKDVPGETDETYQDGQEKLEVKKISDTKIELSIVKVEDGTPIGLPTILTKDDCTATEADVFLVKPCSKVYISLNTYPFPSGTSFDYSVVSASGVVVISGKDISQDDLTTTPATSPPPSRLDVFSWNSSSKELIKKGTSTAIGTEDYKLKLRVHKSSDFSTWEVDTTTDVVDTVEVAKNSSRSVIGYQSDSEFWQVITDKEYRFGSDQCHPSAKIVVISNPATTRCQVAITDVVWKKPIEPFDQPAFRVKLSLSSATSPASPKSVFGGKNTKNYYFHNTAKKHHTPFDNDINFGPNSTQSFKYWNNGTYTFKLYIDRYLDRADYLSNKAGTTKINFKKLDDLIGKDPTTSPTSDIKIKIESDTGKNTGEKKVTLTRASGGGIQGLEEVYSPRSNYLTGTYTFQINKPTSSSTPTRTNNFCNWSQTDPETNCKDSFTLSDFAVVKDPNKDNIVYTSIGVSGAYRPPAGGLVTASDSIRLNKLKYGNHGLNHPSPSWRNDSIDTSAESLSNFITTTYRPTGTAGTESSATKIITHSIKAKGAYAGSAIPNQTVANLINDFNITAANRDKVAVVKGGTYQPSVTLSWQEPRLPSPHSSKIYFDSRLSLTNIKAKNLETNTTSSAPNTTLTESNYDGSLNETRSIPLTASSTAATSPGIVPYHWTANFNLALEAKSTYSYRWLSSTTYYGWKSGSRSRSVKTTKEVPDPKPGNPGNTKTVPDTYTRWSNWSYSYSWTTDHRDRTAPKNTDTAQYSMSRLGSTPVHTWKTNTRTVKDTFATITISGKMSFCSRVLIAAKPNCVISPRLWSPPHPKIRAKGRNYTVYPAGLSTHFTNTNLNNENNFPMRINSSSWRATLSSSHQTTKPPNAYNTVNTATGTHSHLANLEPVGNSGDEQTYTEANTTALAWPGKWEQTHTFNWGSYASRPGFLPPVGDDRYKGPLGSQGNAVAWAGGEKTGSLTCGDDIYISIIPPECSSTPLLYEYKTKEVLAKAILRNTNSVPVTVTKAEVKVGTGVFTSITTPTVPL